MVKVEIIANQAIEEDIIDALSRSGHEENFTWFSPVYGRGKHGRREASSIWPEENIFFYAVIEDSEINKVLDELKIVKDKFPGEGMRCYIVRNIEREL